MIWLRHELWEYNDGLGYRLADRTGADETGLARREGTLRHVFYAPTPAAAKAQYWALRQLGPIIPSRFESDEPFTLAQLQAQLAQFPDDATLSGQPALHPDEDAGASAAPLAVPVVGSVVETEPEGEARQSLEPWPVIAHSEPVTEAERLAAGTEADPAVAQAETVSNVVPIRIAANDAAPRPEADDLVAEPRSREMAALERQPASGALALALAELGPAAASSGALALALAELEPTPHAMPDDDRMTPGSAPPAPAASHSNATGDEPPAHEPVALGTGAVEPLVPEAAISGSHVVEPLVPEPVASETTDQPDPLGPITVVGTPRAKRRKTGFFGGLLRVLILLIVFGAIIVGVGLATGRLDGPTLLAQARAAPEQVRNLSIVKTLLP